MPASKPAARLINSMTSRRDVAEIKTTTKAVKMTNRTETSDSTLVGSSGSRRKPNNRVDIPLASLQIGPTLLREGTSLGISLNGKDAEFRVTGKKESFLRFTSKDVFQVVTPKSPALKHYKLVLDAELPDLTSLWVSSSRDGKSELVARSAPD